MSQGLAMFFGILGFSYATIDNARAPIWVVDPKVEQPADNQPLKDTDVDRVRSVRGVSWAAPFYTGQTQARVLSTGETKPITLVGLDSATLAGAPTEVVKGSILALVCDEPTSALDSATGTQVMELLMPKPGDAGHTVIVVTHDPRTYHCADRIAEMEDGVVRRTLTKSAPGWKDS